MNELERLVENLRFHVWDHKDKSCEVWVNVGNTKTYRLTGEVASYGSTVVLMATEDGRTTFEKP